MTIQEIEAKEKELKHQLALLEEEKHAVIRAVRADLADKWMEITRQCLEAGMTITIDTPDEFAEIDYQTGDFTVSIADNCGESWNLCSVDIEYGK